MWLILNCVNSAAASTQMLSGETVMSICMIAGVGKALAGSRAE